MKTHILLATLAAVFLTACASHEGRAISSTPDKQQQQEEQFHRVQGSSDREFGR